MALMEWLDERSVRAEELPDVKYRRPKSGLKTVGSSSPPHVQAFFIPTWSRDAICL